VTYPTNNRRTWLMRALLLVLVAIPLSGCSHVCPLKATIDAPPNLNKIPLTVGVFYNSDLRNYEHSRAIMQHRWVVPIGNASVSLFDLALPMIFERVVNASSRPPYQEEKQKLAAVIEPTIEEFNFSVPFALGGYEAEISYRFTLYSLDGTPFASWTVKGEGKRGTCFDCLTHARPIGEATDLAMQDAAKKFLVGFSEVPEVRLWLRRNGLLKPE